MKTKTQTKNQTQECFNGNTEGKQLVNKVDRDTKTNQPRKASWRFLTIVIVGQSLSLNENVPVTVLPMEYP